MLKTDVKHFFVGRPQGTPAIWFIWTQSIGEGWFFCPSQIHGSKPQGSKVGHNRTFFMFLDLKMALEPKLEVESGWS